MKPQNLGPAPEAKRRLLVHDGERTLTLMRCLPGTGPAPHSHFHKQIVYVLEGGGEFRIGGELRSVAANSWIDIPADVPHTFERVDEETVWLEFFTPGREDLAGQD